MRQPRPVFPVARDRLARWRGGRCSSATALSSWGAKRVSQRARLLGEAQAPTAGSAARWRDSEIGVGVQASRDDPVYRTSRTRTVAAPGSSSENTWRPSWRARDRAPLGAFEIGVEVRNAVFIEALRSTMRHSLGRPSASTSCERGREVGSFGSALRGVLSHWLNSLIGSSASVKVKHLVTLCVCHSGALVREFAVRGDWPIVAFSLSR